MFGQCQGYRQDGCWCTWDDARPWQGSRGHTGRTWGRSGPHTSSIPHIQPHRGIHNFRNNTILVIRKVCKKIFFFIGLYGTFYIIFTVLLAHLSTKWQFFVRRPSVRTCVRECVNFFSKTTSPLKPLIGFLPNFTGMIHRSSCTKVVQTIPVGCSHRVKN